MKIKMEVVYGDDICEALKETFGCDTDYEFLIAFRAVVKAALSKEAADSEDISVKVDIVD